jgi:exodeoxyribonuclease VII small subunit
MPNFPMATKKSTREPSNKPSFEETMQRLGEIVGELESGELPLAESLARFEEGIRLARGCQTELDEAEARVEELLKIGADGTPVLEEMEDE